MTNIDFPSSPTLDQVLQTPKADFTWKSDRWRRTAPIPPPKQMTLIVPNRAPFNTAATVSVMGYSFEPTDVLWLASGQVATTFVSDTELRFTVPAYDTAQTIKVWGFADSGLGAQIEPLAGLDFIIDPAPLVITSFSPASSPWQATAVDITITGSGFVSGTLINWDGVLLSSTYSLFVSSTQMVVTWRDFPIHGQLPVFAQGPSGNVSNTLMYPVTGGPPLTVTAISPSTAAQGATIPTLTVTGTQFTNGLRIMLDGVAKTTTFVNATTLTTPNVVAPFSVPKLAVNVETNTGADIPLVLTGAPGSVTIDTTVYPGQWPHSGANNAPWWGNCYCYINAGPTDGTIVVHMDGTSYPTWMEGPAAWFTPDYRPGQDPASSWYPKVTVVRNGVPSANYGTLVVGGV